MAAAPACAYYSQEDGERLNNEVYALQTQVNAMQQALAELQETEKQRKKQLAQMSAELADLSKSARRNDADIGVNIDEVRETIARLKGQVESFNQRVTDLEANTSKTQEELDLRFQNLAEQQKIEEAQSEEAKQEAIEEAKRRERLLSSPGELFKEVDTLIEKDQPQEARRLLRELMLRKEDDRSFERGRARAQFLVGETFFAEGNYQQAAAEYNTVRKNHGRSKWTAHAIYKLGRCFEQLNLPGDAKLFYQTVRKKYPRSEVAKEARARLKALN